MAMFSAARLSEVFVEIADTLVGEFDLIEFLQMVTAHTSDLVDARAAGLMLADDQGRLQLMAASDEHTEMLELFQIQAQEGPSHDCYRAGKPVVNADLRTAADRWPKLAPRAVAAGYRSVHAFPLRLRHQVIGARTSSEPMPGTWHQRTFSWSRRLPTWPPSGCCRSAPSGMERRCPRSCRSRWRAGR